MRAPINAMILAAGFGRRMQPLTNSIPKPLLEVGGRTLIDRHIDALALAGFERVVINVHHLADQIVDHVSEQNRSEIEIVFSREIRLLETAGGIRKALPLLGDEPFAVVNGDIYTDYDFARLPGELGDKLGHLVMVDNPRWHSEGDFALDKTNTLSMVGDRLTYGCISVYDPAFFDSVGEEPCKLITLYEPAIANRQLSGEHYRGIWHDVGTQDRLAALNSMLE